MLRCFDVSEVQKDPAMQLSFQMVLQNRFSLIDNTSGPIEWWDSMKDVMKKVGEEVIYQKK